MVSWVRRSVVCAGIIWLAGVPSPPARACDLPPPETATVLSVLDGETLKLADGRIVKLIGAKAPIPPLGWRGDDPWPFVDEAKAALERLASNKAIELRFGGSRTDRHGHLLAHVFVVAEESRLWLQDALVGSGLARVYSLPDNRACTPELLRREDEARAKRLGLWASPAFRIEDARDVERLGRLIHSYQLVEGTVLNVARGAAASISTSRPTGGAISRSAWRAKTLPPLPLPDSTLRRSPARVCVCEVGLPGATVR